MRRISTHIQLLAILAVLCLTGGSLAAATAWGAAGSSVNLSSSEKAELDKQVQEQLAKDKAGQSTGGAQGATGAGATGEGLGNPSSSLVQKAEAEAGTGAEEPATKTTTSTSTTESGGISTGVLVPIFIAGVLLLGGIAFLIVRDARSVAPVPDGMVGGSRQDRAARQRKRRAKARAARQQRKRNR
jgi:hypothetical protein